MQVTTLLLVEGIGLPEELNNLSLLLLGRSVAGGMGPGLWVVAGGVVRVPGRRPRGAGAACAGRYCDVFSKWSLWEERWFLSLINGLV